MATTKEGAEKGEEPALGIPYPYSSGAAPAHAGAAVAALAPAPGHYHYVRENPYQAGMIPPTRWWATPRGSRCARRCSATPPPHSSAPSAAPPASPSSGRSRVWRLW
uniref:Uncharacterized protein n=1 Tax=Ananas comosus var. bracteatus TaxID=296719 RepID=A0A6V7Q0G1_ANACO|nr:unnamed protein product [Ananas comosus var. bracteatus]